MTDMNLHVVALTNLEGTTAIWRQRGSGSSEVLLLKREIVA